MIKTACFFLIGLLITACSSNTELNKYDKVVYVNHYMSECYGIGYGMGFRFCIQTKEEKGKNWSSLNNHIKGFDYEWGYVYKLKVNFDDSAPHQDYGTSRVITLIDVLEKKKVPSNSPFQITYHLTRGSKGLKKISQATYEIIHADNKKIECSPELCKGVDSLISQNKSFILSLQHQEDPSQPLILSSLDCSASNEIFMESCVGKNIDAILNK